MNASSDLIRVRFAPSPTGHLHVGGARTALFNYLFAKSMGGKFLLRIEDTDTDRSDDRMTKEICDSLKWLGLTWDEEILYQSARTQKYLEKSYKLLSSGLAYKCYCSPEELDRKRKETQKSGKQYKYDKTCKFLSEKTHEKHLNNDDKYAVRFAIPEEGITIVKDLVYGDVEFANDEIDDFIIVRRNLSPTYQLAVVTDDAEMNVTHVIRGDDHLSNTPKQLLIFQALKLKPPIYAHLPLIMGSDNTRLSKRHGATSIEEFHRQGILPGALVNHLAFLGWSPKDDSEIMSMEELIGRFRLEGVSRKSAIFDYKKLLWLNGKHLSAISAEELLPAAVEAWKLGELSSEKLEYVKNVIDIVKQRAKSKEELVYFGGYFFNDPESYDEKGRKKYWSERSVNENLKTLLNELEREEDFSAENLEDIVRKNAESLGIKAAGLIHPLRLALTGFSVSPGVFEVMNLLGKETVLRRIKTALERLP